MRVVGYVRVSTQGQADSGLGLEAQRRAILAEVERRGWTLAEIIEDHLSGKDTKRFGLRRALKMMENGQADVLMVSKLDRLSRSTLDFASMLDRAKREGWTPLALDSPVDMTTPHGEAMAGVQAVFAQLERRLIGQRTREALAVKKAQGVQLGRPLTVPANIIERIADERADGRSLRAIADGLTADSIPTGHGRSPRWQHTAVRAIIQRAERLAA